MIDSLSDDNKEWIEDVLGRLDMVTWDRFTVADDPHLGTVVEPYGWIDREKDEYKDFVVIRFFPDSDDHLVGVSTSSEQFSEEIQRRIYEDGAEGHNECQRVEFFFDVPNVLEGLECTECGKTHTDYEKVSTRTINSLHHSGLADVVECGNCGETQEVNLRR